MNPTHRSTAVDPTCPFCSIVAGRTPAHVVYEDDVCVGFLDGRPLFAGHILLVPRTHVPTLPDLPPTLVGPVFLAVRRLCSAVEVAVASQGTFVAVNNRVSQSVPHLHVHVVPRTKGDGLRGFFWPRHHYESEERAEQVAEAIRAALAELE